MSFGKWKVAAAALCLVAMSAGVGWFGSATASSDNPLRATAKVGKFASAGNPDRDPIRADLVLREDVQKELRLSKNQIQKLQHAWKAGKKQAADEVQRGKEIDEQIAELEKKLRALRLQRNSVAEKIYQAQEKSLEEAIYKHLSDQAVGRLRQITLQQKDLLSLLTNSRIQAKLNLNDEQIKKLQELLKKSPDFRFTELLHLSNFVPDRHELRLKVAEAKLDHVTYAVLASSARRLLNDPDLMKILTPQQRETWRRMIGEPYPRPKVKSKK